MLLGLFLILSPFILCEAVGGFWSIDPHMKITSGKDTTTVAWAYYSQDVNTTGWATLSITTNDKFPNELQARAAGYLEGYLTSDLIYMSWLPSLQTMVPGGKLNNQVLSYFKQNLEWMETMIVERGPTDKYWNQAGLLLEQIKGITSGRNFFLFLFCVLVFLFSFLFSLSLFFSFLPLSLYRFSSFQDINMHQLQINAFLF